MEASKKVQTVDGRTGGLNVSGKATWGVGESVWRKD